MFDISPIVLILVCVLLSLIIGVGLGKRIAPRIAHQGLRRLLTLLISAVVLMLLVGRLSTYLNEAPIAHSAACTMIAVGLATLGYVAYRLDVFNDLTRAIIKPGYWRLSFRKASIVIFFLAASFALLSSPRLVATKDSGRNKVSSNEGVEAPRQQGARREHTLLY